MRVIKSFSVYASALFINAALSFGTFSLLTYHLSEVDYGIINLYGSFTIFIVPFVSVGVPFTLSVDYFKMDEVAFRRHFTNAILIPLLMCAVITLIFLVFHAPLQGLLKTNLLFLLTLPLNCLLLVLGEVMLSIIRNKGRHFLYGGFSVFRNVIEVSVTLLFVIGLGFAWTGRLWGVLISLLASGAGMLYLIKRWRLFSNDIDRKDIKSIFKQGLPFIPERLSIFFMSYSDRFFVDHYSGTGEVGFYGAGAQVALIVNLASLSLISTFHPYLYKHIRDENWSSVRKGTFAFIGIALFVTIAVLFATPLIFKLFISENFQTGQMYARNLTIGFFLWSVHAVFVAYLLYLKLNKKIMMISIIGMTVSFVLNSIMVRQFGAIGATYTSILAYFTMAALCIYIVHRQFNLKRILFPK